MRLRREAREEEAERSASVLRILQGRAFWGQKFIGGEPVGRCRASGGMGYCVWGRARTYKIRERRMECGKGEPAK